MRVQKDTALSIMLLVLIFVITIICVTYNNKYKNNVRVEDLNLEWYQEENEFLNDVIIVQDSLIATQSAMIDDLLNEASFQGLDVELIKSKYLRSIHRQEESLNLLYEIQ